MEEVEAGKGGRKRAREEGDKEEEGEATPTGGGLERVQATTLFNGGERYCVGAAVEFRVEGGWCEGTIIKYNRGNATIDLEDGTTRDIKLPDAEVRLLSGHSKKARKAAGDAMEDGG